MLLNVKKIKVLESPVSTELKVDRNGENLAHRHLEGSFSVFLPSSRSFCVKAGSKTLQNSSMSKKISVTLSLEIMAEILVKYLVFRYLNILNFRFSIA